jgi:hypothetical protein
VLHLVDLSTQWFNCFRDKIFSLPEISLQLSPFHISSPDYTVISEKLIIHPICYLD